MGGKMKTRTKKSAIRTALLSVVLFALILTKYSNIGFPSAAIARQLAVAASNLVHLTKSLNLSQYHLDIGNMCLVAFLVLLFLWRSLLIRKAQI